MIFIICIDRLVVAVCRVKEYRAANLKIEVLVKHLLRTR